MKGGKRRQQEGTWTNTVNGKIGNRTGWEIGRYTLGRVSMFSVRLSTPPWILLPVDAL